MRRTRIHVAALAAAAALATIFPAPSIGFAECSPERLVKIVFQVTTPGVDPNSFLAKPKTLYRYGVRYARLEEPPDPETKQHRLFVVNEPDVYMVNLLDRTGRHVVDPGPSFKFFGPVLGLITLPFPLGELEFGCEMAFMKERATEPPKRVGRDGADLDQRTFASGSRRVDLFVRPGESKPWALESWEDGKITYAVRYLEYVESNSPDLRLFERPRGIAYAEGPPQEGNRR